ncbi:beta-lactamase repressor [Paenibacillus sp. CCS19]|uniref:BlaI/MecI/CopY family transcriptional regulator n=1 Tax=Paenibacillus sp. CCS19 TaxID=3158387 RepID=UPI00255F1EED|nr:BlaI/MecI/CopY family transcriptional regulator [Paenibacillus cellulosilyticus]GMK38582.1 beta-lactamase repressor [Paenibacillus cellulosilyticus]
MESTNPMPRISEAEWEVMKVVWANAPMTASDVVAAIGDSKTWNPKTVRSLMSRLVEKGALGCTVEGKSYTYFPLVKEEECVRSETSSLLRRVYGGALKPMLVNFLSDEQLTKADIEELKQILDRRKD